MENNLNQEIIEHLMHPRNYGPLENATGIGVSHSEKTGEFVIFYIETKDNNLKNVGYATNGCHDTVVLGSMFTEMIKGGDLNYAKVAAEKLREQVAEGPQKQQACAHMVLSAFDAAQIHEQQRGNGSAEELFAIEIKMECEVESHD